MGLVGHPGRGGEQAGLLFPRLCVLFGLFARFSGVMDAFGRKRHGLRFGLAAASGTVARPGIVERTCCPMVLSVRCGMDGCALSEVWLLS